MCKSVTVHVVILLSKQFFPNSLIDSKRDTVGRSNIQILVQQYKNCEQCIVRRWFFLSPKTIPLLMIINATKRMSRRRKPEICFKKFWMTSQVHKIFDDNLNALRIKSQFIQIIFVWRNRREHRPIYNVKQTCSKIFLQWQHSNHGWFR